MESLRNALGEKSFVFRSQVRNAKSQKKMTRSWGEVNKIEVQVQAFARTYRTARNALIQLRAGKKILDHFEELSQEDLKMSGDIIEENRMGQRNEKLAWFWRLDGKGEDDECMKECALFICINEMIGLKFICIVYRVSWLRMKARLDRWQEEKRLLKEEMIWTVESFKYQETQWGNRAERLRGKDEKEGHVSYALRESNMWVTFGRKASVAFQALET